MGTVVEPYLFVGFHFFLSSKNALFQGNEVEMSTLHFHFCDFRGDIALQIPCDLEVAVDRFSDGKLSVVEDCVDPFVDGDVHRFDWPFDPEEVTFRLREGNGDADGEPYAVDHVAEEHIVARVNPSSCGNAPQFTGHERHIPAFAVLVYGLGHRLLTCTIGTEYHHGHIRWSYQLGEFLHL